MLFRAAAAAAYRRGAQAYKVEAASISDIMPACVTASQVLTHETWGVSTSAAIILSPFVVAQPGVIEFSRPPPSLQTQYQLSRSRNIPADDKARPASNNITTKSCYHIARMIAAAHASDNKYRRATMILQQVLFRCPPCISMRAGVIVLIDTGNIYDSPTR